MGLFIVNRCIAFELKQWSSDAVPFQTRIQKRQAVSTPDVSEINHSIAGVRREDLTMTTTIFSSVWTSLDRSTVSLPSFGDVDHATTRSYEVIIAAIIMR